MEALIVTLAVLLALIAGYLIGINERGDEDATRE